MTRIGNGDTARSASLTWPLGCVLASVATLLGHLAVHLWFYGSGPAGAHPLRFFPRPGLVVAGALSASALWCAIALIRTRPREAGVARIPPARLLGIAVGAGAALSVAATLLISEFDRAGAWAVIALVTGIPAAALTVLLAAILALLVARLLRVR